MFNSIDLHFIQLLFIYIPLYGFSDFHHDSFLQSSSPLARTDYTVHRAVEIIDSEGHVLICTYFDITYTSVICIMIPCSYFGLDLIRGAVHVFAATEPHTER